MAKVEHERSGEESAVREADVARADVPRGQPANGAARGATAEATAEALTQAAGEARHGVVSAPGPKLSREDEAKLALEHTVIAPAVAWTLSLLFLLTIFAVPILQNVVEVRRNGAERRQEAARGETPPASQTSLLPQSFEVFAALPSREQIQSVRGPRDAWALMPSGQKLKEFEESLEDQSVVAGWTLPRVQRVLTTRLGVGNEQAYVGRDGWLQYRPDVDYLTSRGFLDPALLQVRRRSGDEETAAVQPDPVKAIVGFKRQLAARGIELIVMPAPVKAMIHPEKLSPRYTPAQGLIQNPSFEPFRRALEREGVKVFDASPALIEAKRRTGRAQYLETDTHWTPEAMELAAAELARFIRERVALPRPEEPLLCSRRAVQVSNLGDIATMLKLPPNQKLFKPQRVRIRQVRTPDGELWYSTRDADVLLLGDSFSNIYSFGEMGWGESAGLAEQISFHLRRPLDAIINNAGGAYTTRLALRRDLARGKDRLKGKRLVIWEFAMRDLLVGDWKLLDLPPAKAKSTTRAAT